MKQIMIIGTLPPCPRCKLLTEAVTARVKTLGILDCQVRHIAYTSQEAGEIARGLGLEPGTAKDVAKRLGTEIHLEEMPGELEPEQEAALAEITPDLAHLASLFREVAVMDQWLRPFENKARENGILMTPVLLVSGEVKHNGSVPAVASIDAWLEELK